MSEKMSAKLKHDDGELRSDSVNWVVIQVGADEFRIGMNNGRLEVWTFGPIAVIPITGNTVAIERRK